jgi:hypothetical protein
MFSPAVGVLVLFDLDRCYNSCLQGFLYEEFLDPFSSFLIVPVILICYPIELRCELGCGGVRLPSSCALHIFPCIFPSNPLIACFYVRRWFPKFALWLMVWSCLSSCGIQRGRWRGGGLWVGLLVCVLLSRWYMWCRVSCRISPSQISTHNIA